MSAASGTDRASGDVSGVAVPSGVGSNQSVLWDRMTVLCWLLVHGWLLRFLRNRCGPARALVRGTDQYCDWLERLLVLKRKQAAVAGVGEEGGFW